ncbi:unnamed protein product [Rhizoctonia solani]|uniref:CcmS related domain-containing protein n=1 Tax=Rhizoctonia solani TaxID=456999 RepID=A0A8H2X7B5_9AGAM|nr:unnamed protein product [Rhizoctonia solani]
MTAPVPAIGGKNLRADEALLGLSDWEIGDHSTRYPQSLLSSSFDGGRWGGSAVGTSVMGSTAAYSSVGGSNMSHPSLTIPSSKASQVSSGMSPTRSEATHHVRRKKPPTLDPNQSTPSAPPSTASSSPPKSSVSKIPSDGVVRPGDIVPPDWSAAAVSVIGSVPPSVAAPTPAPTSNVESTTATSISNPPSFKQPQNRRSSQPTPRAPPSAYSHSHTHSQPLISVPTLPPIAASPRTSVADAPNPAHSNLRPLPTQAASTSVPPPSSTVTASLQGAASMTLQTALGQILPSPQNSGPQDRAKPPAPSSYVTDSKLGNNPSGPQSLQVPPSQYRPSPQPHPAPASVVGSHVSGRSSQSSRALPVPPPRSVASAANTTLQATPAVPHPPSSSIQVWRAGVMTSGPRGWGATPPGPQISQQNFSQSAYSTPASTPTSAQARPDPYQPDPYLARTQHQLAAPPHPVRRYSYDTPTSGLPLPSQQLSTNLDGYMSSPDVTGMGGASPATADSRPNPPDDGKPGLQRAPSKLRRKLTKNRGWVPNAPATAAPALSTPAAASTSTSGSALAPREQFASKRATSLKRVVQSGGQALVPAQRAFIGSHRPAHERMLWGLPLDRDPRVRHAIAKIESIKDSVILFGAEQFVETKMKGAVVCNVDYHAPGHPDDLAFDWITYKDAQKTLDPTLQKSVTRTDPASAVLVVIFLLSPSLNSLAIWRKSVPIDSTLDRVLAYRVERVKREIAGQEKDMAIRL